jgi:mRNA interferase RelE/StbE
VRYKVVFAKKAEKDLKKLDNSIKSKIRLWIRNNLEGCENPRIHGKALVANHSGLWRYRIGDYRIIAEIQDEQLVILLLQVGHRRDIYG